MATTDLEVFIQERLRAYDPNVDLSTGSTADQQVVQPILRRIGPDPFTMELDKFIATRLQQEFPELATASGDGIMDVVGVMRVLMEPVVQEVKRVRDNLSFSDPATLDISEAEALGANYFSPRQRGDYARATVRLYFSAPQSVVITPGNYCFTGGGLRFLPTAIQSIGVNEMLFNREGSYYYFDISTIADAVGEAYNVAPESITGIYGAPSVVRVMNKLRATGGLEEETAPEYVDRLEQDLTERSPVTLRGILAVLGKYFPGIIRAAIVGFNDPEMQRDVLMGGGLGTIILSGGEGYPVDDGEGASYTRRFRVDDAGIDFTSTIGPIRRTVVGYAVTVVGADLRSGSSADLHVRRVIDAKTLEFDEQFLKPWHAGSFSYWMLRKNVLTVSGVEGGTELTGPNGEVTVNSNTIHIGGMTDVYVRGAGTDQNILILGAVTDDEPLLNGTKGMRYPGVGTPTGFQLTDYVLGPSGNYSVDDDTYKAFDTAKDKGLTLQLMDGDVGSYRILAVSQVVGDSPIIVTDPAPLGSPLEQRWKMLDELDIDLRTPKETKLSGGDLFTIQGNKIAQVPSVPDLSVYGVGKGDYLELLTGPDAGVFTIAEDTATNQMTVDRAFINTTAGVSYRIYRRLSDSNMSLPLVRVRSIDLLDTSGEPIGVAIPLANPLDIRSSDFTSPTNSLKIDIRDGVVGCVGKALTSMPSLSGKVLRLECQVWVPSYRLVTFGATPDFTSLTTQINTAVGEYIASIVGDNHLGIAPSRGQYNVTVVTAGANDAMPLLFDTTGGLTQFSTNYIRSTTVEGYSSSWGTYAYDLNFDTVQVVSTSALGFGVGPRAEQGNRVLAVNEDFLPAVNALVRVGPRSVGTARAYFLEPTTFEVDATTRFDVTLDDGTVLGYYPDPTVSTLRYPPPPSTLRAKDGTTTNDMVGGVFGSVSVDFIKKGILPGDELTVDFVPVIGDIALTAANIVGLALTTFVVRIAGVERTLVFGSDSDTDPTAVSLTGAVQQLARLFGADTVQVNSTTKYLEIETSYEFTILSGTSLSYFWTDFVGTYPTGASNLSPNYRGGRPYVVYNVAANDLYVTESFTSTSATRQQFKVVRPGSQRTGTTQMALNTTYAGLYYADVQLVSEGTGVLYNVRKNEAMGVSGHKSLGYYMTTEQSHLSFSTAEKPHLHITPTIISIGASDDPENALHIAGQNIQINYDWSSLASAAQTFFISEYERVTNANMLVRHLLPHYVRFDLVYRGGQAETEVVSAITDYINGLNPDDQLEAVQVQNKPLSMGATSVSTPIDLVALVYAEDRSVRAEQSQDYLNTGRLAGFFVDTINAKRNTT